MRRSTRKRLLVTSSRITATTYVSALSTTREYTNVVSGLLNCIMRKTACLNLSHLWEQYVLSLELWDSNLMKSRTCTINVSHATMIQTTDGAQLHPTPSHSLQDFACWQETQIAEHKTTRTKRTRLFSSSQETQVKCTASQRHSPTIFK